jgi:hypothetical protein
VNYITTCIRCNEKDSKLRPIYIHKKDGDRMGLSIQSTLEEQGFSCDIFAGLSREDVDHIELSCSFCGDRSNLENYEIPDASKVTVPDVEALRRDINSMLDTARFAPRPPVFEPKPKTKPCKACTDGCGCDTYEEAPEDGYCECSGCDGCDSCRCCCNCNDDENEDPADDHTDEDPPATNTITQAGLRAMQETDWLAVRNNIVFKLEAEDVEGVFTICDWENRRLYSFQGARLAAEKFMDLTSNEAELFVQNLSLNSKQRVAAWNERVLNID